MNYDLEEAIYQMDQTGKDLEMLFEYYLDCETPMTEDEVANTLLGLQMMHKIRYEKLWDCYIRDKKLDKYAPPEAMAYREKFIAGWKEALKEGTKKKKKK